MTTSSTRTYATTACTRTSRSDAGQSLTVRSLLNAAYLGSYYLPSVSVEAMYDATTYGRTAGTWVTVADEGP